MVETKEENSNAYQS